MPINYNKLIFKVSANSPNGDTSGQTLFAYRQEGELIWAEYKGGIIVKGHLLGTADRDGKLKFAYHHLNQAGELMTGTCVSRPEVMPSGKLRLHEEWQWTSGDLSSGTSILEQV